MTASRWGVQREEEAGEGVGHPGMWLWCVEVEVCDGGVDRTTRYSV